MYISKKKQKEKWKKKKKASKGKGKAKKKKKTWLQACLLGDVEVIWCNSLGDSHFQTYVMNNVESVFFSLFTYHLVNISYTY